MARDDTKSPSGLGAPKKIRSRRRRRSDSQHVVRFSVSLPPEVGAALDRLVEERHLPSRSHAVAEMVRQHATLHRASLAASTLAGTVTIVYQDTGANLRVRLNRIQRKYVTEVISSQHVFLEDEQSLEVLLVQGPGPTLRQLCNEIIACRGVLQAQLTVSAALLLA